MHSTKYVVQRNISDIKYYVGRKIESNLLNVAANSDDASSLNALLTEYKIKKYLTLLV